MDYYLNYLMEKVVFMNYTLTELAARFPLADGPLPNTEFIKSMENRSWAPMATQGRPRPTKDPPKTLPTPKIDPKCTPNPPQIDQKPTQHRPNFYVKGQSKSFLK